MWIHSTCVYCLQLSCGTQWFTMPGLMFLLMFNPNSVHKIESTVDLQGYIQQTFPIHLRSYFENQSRNVIATRVPPIPALQQFQTHGCWIPVSKSEFPICTECQKFHLQIIVPTAGRGVLTGTNSSRSWKCIPWPKDEVPRWNSRLQWSGTYRRHAGFAGPA